MNKPRTGARFIHARYLRDDARPPYTEDSYREHVVTSTRPSGDTVLVMHTTAEAWDKGGRRGSWFFTLDRAAEHVRRWI